MPEGDVVWRTAHRLHEALAGGAIAVWGLRWPSLATTDLRGDVVREVAARGKHLLLRTEAGWTLHSHLRMEGSWHIARPGSSQARHSDVRALVGTARWWALGRRLGMLDVLRCDDESRVVGHLGPDVLGPDWDAGLVTDTMAARPERGIGESLLDQTVLAGVGTFYMCEACFIRGVTPWTPVGETDAATLIALVHRLLVANRDRAVQVTTGDMRRGQTQYVHSRSGSPCRRCGTTIRVARLGEAPRDRVAFFCPRCQKGPRPADDGMPARPLGSSIQRLR